MTVRNVPMGKKGFTLAQNTHGHFPLALLVPKDIASDLRHQPPGEIYFLTTDFEAPP